MKFVCQETLDEQAVVPLEEGAKPVESTPEELERLENCQVWASEMLFGLSEGFPPLL